MRDENRKTRLGRQCSTISLSRRKRRRDRSKAAKSDPRRHKNVKDANESDRREESKQEEVQNQPPRSKRETVKPQTCTVNAIGAPLVNARMHVCIGDRREKTEQNETKKVEQGEGLGWATFGHV